MATASVQKGSAQHTSESACKAANQYPDGDPQQDHIEGVIMTTGSFEFHRYYFISRR